MAKRKSTTKCILYKITFLNGKSYIGITSNTLKRRMILHFHHAKKGRDCPLHRAIRKYGKKSISVQILLVTGDWSYLCEMEKKAIVAFGTLISHGYNLSPGGEGTLGYKFTKEQCLKTSEALKGKNLGNQNAKGYRHTEEARRKIAKAGIGRVFSEEARAKIGATKIGNKYNVGRLCSEETARKISEAQKGRPKTFEQKRAMSLAAKKRHPVSEKTKAKLRIAALEQWRKQHEHTPS